MEQLKWWHLAPISGQNTIGPSRHGPGFHPPQSLLADYYIATSGCALAVVNPIQWWRVPTQGERAGADPGSVFNIRKFSPRPKIWWHRQCLGPCWHVAGTSCLVQPGPKLRALFIKHCQTESPNFHPPQSHKCLLGSVYKGYCVVGKGVVRIYLGGGVVLRWETETKWRFIRSTFKARYHYKCFYVIY